MQKAAAAAKPDDVRIRAAAAKEQFEGLKHWDNNAITVDSLTTEYDPTTSGVYFAQAIPMSQTYSSANLGI